MSLEEMSNWTNPQGTNSYFFYYRDLMFWCELKDKTLRWNPVGEGIGDNPLIDTTTGLYELPDGTRIPRWTLELLEALGHYIEDK